MTIWGFLKGIIPEKLININVDNRKIEIKDSSVVIGDQTINDPEIVDKILDKIGEFKNKESLPCQIVHEDLSDSFLEYEEIKKDEKENIKKMESVLLPQDMECIITAMRIKREYDKGHKKRAQKIHRELIKSYPDKGSKVYNLIGGGYFDEILIPFIEVHKSEFGEKYIDEYRKFYADLIRFFPLAVFVGNSKTVEDVRRELLQRLEKNIPFVRLHAIGKYNIDKIEKVTEELNVKKYSKKDNRFTTSTGLKAQIYEIRF